MGESLTGKGSEVDPWIAKMTFSTAPLPLGLEVVKMRLIVGCLVVALSLVSCRGAEKQKQAPVAKEPARTEEKVAMLTVASSAFEPGGPIPRRHSGEGEDVSPPISWSRAPEGTVEFALICDDPDAPRAEPWVHWVVYKIPADVTSLPEGSAGGAVVGKNTAGRTAYMGPSPPRGHGVHHYHFKVYALAKALDLDPGAAKRELLEAMEGLVLAEGEVVGTYER